MTLSLCSTLSLSLFLLPFSPVAAAEAAQKQQKQQPETDRQKQRRLFCPQMNSHFTQSHTANIRPPVQVPFHPAAIHPAASPAEMAAAAAAAAYGMGVLQANVISYYFFLLPVHTLSFSFPLRLILIHHFFSFSFLRHSSQLLT